MPAYGNAFVTQGYVYPAGTLDGGVEGTLADGGPAFPDKVIGTWTCDGYCVGEGFRTTTGTIVVTRQVIVFDDGDVLITQGPDKLAYAGYPANVCRCPSQSRGNPSSRSSSCASAGCRPSRIASTISGASSVSRSNRLT
jgi:hypothetical protein